MSNTSLARLPNRVLLVYVCITVAIAIAAMLLGWRPSADSAKVVLPLYFATLLTVISLAYVVSGNTLMHHHLTGTVQRASSPGWFWKIVGVQLLIAVVLFFFAVLNWSHGHG